MTSRKKATRDLKIEQGKRRDAFFDRLKRTAQSRAATTAKKQEPQPAQ